jgi:1-acyl-sn-glycerol-3-phosphate acyltransferase
MSRRRTGIRAARAHGARVVRESCSRLDVGWARWGAARALREAVLRFALTPIMQYYVRQRVAGREHLKAVDGPVVLVANHTSHLDTAAILRALPRRWRMRTAVLAAADYFYRNRLVAALVSLIFNTVPVERRPGRAAGEPTAHLDRLISQRWNLLIYPEGTRSRDGELGSLHRGAAYIAAKHGLRILPVRVSGTRAAMPPGGGWLRRPRGRRWLRRHRVEINFGSPIDPKAFPNRAAVMEQVRAYLSGEARDAFKLAVAPSNGEVAKMPPQPPDADAPARDSGATARGSRSVARAS